MVLSRRAGNHHGSGSVRDHASDSAEDEAKPLHVDLVTDDESFLDLEPQWNKLVEQAGIDHPFLRHEWVKSWWDCFGRGGTLYILVVRRDTECVAIAPLMLDRVRLYGCSVRRLHGIANVYTERFDVILGDRPKESCQAMWNHLKAHAEDWDVLELRQLPSDARALEFFPSLVAEDRFLLGQWPSTEAPFVATRQPWDIYYKSLKKAHRANVRNHIRQLERHGPLGMDVVVSDERLDSDLDDAFNLEAVTWKRESGTAIQSREEPTIFYRRILKKASEVGWLRLYFLTVGTKRIAVRISLLYRNKVFMLKSGYDPEYGRYSPGHVLCDHLLREAWTHRFDEVDFLGHTERWKLSWSTGTRSHSWLFVFPNRIKSRLLHGVKFKLIPGLRRSGLFSALRRTISRVGVPIHDE